MITLTSKLLEVEALKGKEAILGAFAEQFVTGLAAEVEKGHQATDSDYIAFQKSINANVKAAPVTRHRILLRKLLQYEPSILDHLDAGVVAAADFDGQIGSLAEEIHTLISKINGAYASKVGGDLFKPTNKTVSAQWELAKVANSEEGYGSLVESLYFLVWEAPGPRLPDKPQSFKDVNTLRTELQHDVDHGHLKDVKKKKLTHAATFEKYAGVSSPSVAAPERFPLAQVKLLSGVKADLQNILEGYS